MLMADEKYPYYFRYRGETYTKKTAVRLTQLYLNAHPVNTGCPTCPRYYGSINSCQMFLNKINLCGIDYYIFTPYKDYGSVYGYIQVFDEYLYIKASEIDGAIEEIIDPKPIVIVPAKKTKDWESPEIMVGWGLYILALLCSFIFKDWPSAWVLASLIFFAWRKKMKDK